MRTETVPTEVEAIAAALVARGVPFHRAVVAFRVAFLRAAMDRGATNLICPPI